jgi:putative nucleotidyltransferase with HDIG domain
MLENAPRNVDVAQEIANLRSIIVDRALSRTLPPERRSLLADVVAKRTVDHLIGWVAEGDTCGLFEWVDSVIVEHPYEIRLFNLFPSTVSAALDVLCEKSQLAERPRHELAHLQQRIDLHIGASFKERNAKELHTLDPVDVKIDELLFQLSAQDALTGEHSRSVGMWCWRVAKHLKLPRDESYVVTRCGLLHDIGKMVTPKEILTAARSLSDEEWTVMRQHAAEGAEIVGKVRELRTFVAGVRSHHERFDGEGYPDRLERARIPVAARVVSVADSFNAMIARRPYRAPFTPTRAIEELKRHSGTQWDPAIVQAMIEVVLSGK